MTRRHSGMLVSRVVGVVLVVAVPLVLWPRNPPASTVGRLLLSVAAALLASPWRGVGYRARLIIFAVAAPWKEP